MKERARELKPRDLFDPDELDVLDEALDIEEGQLVATREYMCGDNVLKAHELRDALDDITRKQEANERVRRWLER